MAQGTQEWNKRIEIWMDELKNQIYGKLDAVTFDGFITKKLLSYEEAVKETFLPMPSGSRWGRKWEYGWFQTTIRLTELAEGHSIYLVPEVGGEMLVWVNGRIAGSVDLEHHGIMLTRSAKAGEAYEITLESYAGHGPRLESGGPNPPERVAVPEPPEFQLIVKDSHLGIWSTEAFDLYMDAFTLYKLWQSLDPKSLRFQKIREGLIAFTKIVDFELPCEERVKTMAAARSALTSLLECTNGSTIPEFTIFGQSHLDLAWKWPWAETRRKCGRTISTQLALCDEYPDYKFLICQPVIMQSVKQDYPELYDRLTKKIAAGQFIPEGGLWVEPDTNIPSGESLIRQCLWGKKWFKEEYGYDTRMVWMPDTFGFSGQLPQIFAGTGMKYFASQKIARALRGHDPFPYNIFYWEGIDGTRILTHFFIKNNARFDPLLLNSRWNQDRVQQENIDTFLYPFGFGDGGGGPTREMLEVANRTRNLEGAPRTRMQSPIAFFEDLEKRNHTRNCYAGEIYLAWHRGSYTAQAKTKKGNRKAENALHELEFWGTLADCLDRDRLQRLWEKLLFHQFHDILAGTSITRVHQEAEQNFNAVILDAGHLTQEALHKITDSSKESKDIREGITVYNSLSWGRQALVRLPEGMTRAWDAQGMPLPVQAMESFCYALVSVPACGYTSIYSQQSADVDGNHNAHQSVDSDGNLSSHQSVDRDGNLYSHQPVDSDESLNSSQIEDMGVLKLCQSEDNGRACKVEACGINQDTYLGSQGVWVTETSMENDFLRLLFDEYGQITSIYDKEAGIEFAAGICNRMCMYQDINVDYDAWELAGYYEEFPIALSESARTEVITQGSLTGTLRITRTLQQSQMLQDVTMTSMSRRIDFRTVIDWQETHRLLKVAFPVQVYTQEAIEEIQFGYVKRPTHKSRPFDADRFEVCNHRYTSLSESNRSFAVLNDCKYGVSTNRNSIELSLLRAPLIPDMYADKGMQEFTYSIYANHCSFQESNIIQQGYELNYPLLSVKGTAGEMSYFQLSNPDILLETLKYAEDGSKDWILRLYEAKGGHSQSNLQIILPFRRVVEVDMQEEIRDSKPLAMSRDLFGNLILQLSFGPFEIKTLRLEQR